MAFLQRAITSAQVTPSTGLYSSIPLRHIFLAKRKSFGCYFCAPNAARPNENKTLAPLPTRNQDCQALKPSSLITVAVETLVFYCMWSFVEEDGDGRCCDSERLGDSDERIREGMV